MSSSTTAKASITESDVIEVLNTVIEKERGRSIYEMGLIHLLEVTNNNIRIEVKPTNPACPVGMKLAYDSKVALLKMPDIVKVDVKIVDHKHASQFNQLLKELSAD